MHLGLTVLLIIIAYWKGDWRNWHKYSLTIFYVINCNFLYHFLCKNFLLWQYKADFLPKSSVGVDLLYTYINLPAITLLFLTNYPYSKRRALQVMYIALWVLSSISMEYPFVKYGRLVLDNGYEYWMDFFFYIAMYSLTRLHQTRPFQTYGISIIIIIFLLWHFNVPIH